MDSHWHFQQFDIFSTIPSLNANTGSSLEELKKIQIHLKRYSAQIFCDAKGENAMLFGSDWKKIPSQGPDYEAVPEGVEGRNWTSSSRNWLSTLWQQNN